MQATDVCEPENDSVTMFVGLMVWGSRSARDFRMCPSAPESSIVGMVRSAAALVRMSWSGGCGGGLHSGGDLALIENPESWLALRSSAFLQR